MIPLTEAQIEHYATVIQNKIDEDVAEFDPHSLRIYALEVSGLGGLCAQLVRSARKIKDKDRTKTDIYEGVKELNGNLHYRLSTLNSVLGYLGKERMAER